MLIRVNSWFSFSRGQEETTNIHKINTNEKEEEEIETADDEDSETPQGPPEIEKLSPIADPKPVGN